MFPFTGGFLAWPLDWILAAAWFTAFAILINSLDAQSCGRHLDWSGVMHAGYCNRWKAAEALSFLSAVFWLVSGIVGIYFLARNRREQAAAEDEDPKLVSTTFPHFLVG
jgi:hypothetical protein